MQSLSDRQRVAAVGTDGQTFTTPNIFHHRQIDLKKHLEPDK